MSDPITIISFLTIGIVFILIAPKLIENRKKLIENGIEVEGVIFDFTDNISFNSSDVANNIKYPIIRFVTKDGIWITEKANFGGSFLFKKGQKVKVVYNAANPKEFIFKTFFDFSKLVYLFIVLGIIFFIVGLWLAYKYLIAKN